MASFLKEGELFREEVAEFWCVSPCRWPIYIDSSSSFTCREHSVLQPTEVWRLPVTKEDEGGQSRPFERRQVVGTHRSHGHRNGACYARWGATKAFGFSSEEPKRRQSLEPVAQFLAVFRLWRAGLMGSIALKASRLADFHVKPPGAGVGGYPGSQRRPVLCLICSLFRRPLRQLAELALVEGHGDEDASTVAAQEVPWRPRAELLSSGVL